MPELLERLVEPSMRHGWRASSPAVGPAAFSQGEAGFARGDIWAIGAVLAKPLFIVSVAERLSIGGESVHTQTQAGATFHG